MVAADERRPPPRLRFRVRCGLLLRDRLRPPGARGAARPERARTAPFPAGTSAAQARLGRSDAPLASRLAAPNRRAYLCAADTGPADACSGPPASARARGLDPR